jgi:hypothetical protein
MENNATSSYISMHAYLNTNTAPITSISIDASRTGSNWAQYSSATLYGIRKY